MKSVEDQIFQKGSTTYYWSSKFFPKAAREDVFKLYSFVRVVDDYVDEMPQQIDEFNQIREMWNLAKKNKKLPIDSDDSDDIKTRIVKNITSVSRKYEFDNAWVEAFFDSMQMDIDKRTYRTINDTLEYIYGSAEVIGLMMAKIMKLPEESFEAARLQGRAMQFINFIRDIHEDIALGRCYIPEEDLAKYGFKQLDELSAKKQPEEYGKLIHFELERYDEWQSDAYEGYVYIPRSLRGPLRTATDMYNWTAEQIRHDPMIVFSKKVKPRKRQVISRAARNMVRG